MDIDRFIVQNQPGWNRLGDLTSAVRRSPSALTDAEIEEFLRLYHRTGTHLSMARTTYRDTALVADLTRTVAAASQALYGTRPRTTRVVADFFLYTFPAVVRHNRWFVALAAAAFFVPGAIMMAWLVASPEALAASGSAEERAFYADELFASYYSENPSAVFATYVGLNNIYVSFLALFGGALLMAPGIAVLVVNGVAFGQVGAWMITEGDGVTFWTLIAPHGLLELSSIILAGAAGLRIGWTVLVPGDDRTRTAALAEEGRRSTAMALGLIVCFIVAALVEGFVTGSALPAGAKVGIGVLVWVAFVLYLITQGRVAGALGLTGSPGELDRMSRDGLARRANTHDGDSDGDGDGDQSRPVALDRR